jgi:hypothetical protein
MPAIEGYNGNCHPENSTVDQDVSSCIALSFDGFGSLLWQSICLFVFFFSALVQFIRFVFGFTTFSAWVPLKRPELSKCTSGASKLVSYYFYILTPGSRPLLVDCKSPRVSTANYYQEKSKFINSSPNDGLSPSCIALSFDEFNSILWHSIWFFLLMKNLVNKVHLILTRK